jgi:hypothetical protein
MTAVTPVTAVAFDFWLPDASLGGFVSLSIGPRRAQFWAGLVGEGRPYVLVKDLDVEPPRRAGSLEIRAEGLWADHNCETPDAHWSFGLEAFGVAFDDPEEALRSEWGDRVALGLDMEWEPGLAHGEILVGTQPVERIEFTGLGTLSFWAPNCTATVEKGAQNGLAAPIRLDDGPGEDGVLRQWLTPEGWVRARDGSAAGTG